MPLSYEEQRLQNIKDNAALLLSLGLEPPKPATAKKKAVVPKAKQAPKKKARAEAAYVDAPPSDDNDEESAERVRRSSRPKKAAKSNGNGDTNLRRSSRQSNAPVRFTQLKDGDDYDDDDSDDDEAGYGGKKRKRKATNHFKSGHEPQRLAQSLGIRTQNPKRFGAIPGVEVGSWWASRMDCSTAAVHAPPVSGISGNAELGAFSVALSGGYADE